MRKAAPPHRPTTAELVEFEKRAEERGQRTLQDWVCLSRNDGR
ncbi:hypothetical protein ABEV34_27330 [Methylorubrum rhodesianum]